jgi:hypothetical protein
MLRTPAGGREAQLPHSADRCSICAIAGVFAFFNNADTSAHNWVNALSLSVGCLASAADSRRPVGSVSFWQWDFACRTHLGRFGSGSMSRVIGHADHGFVGDVVTVIGNTCRSRSERSKAARTSSLASRTLISANRATSAFASACFRAAIAFWEPFAAVYAAPRPLPKPPLALARTLAAAPAFRSGRPRVRRPLPGRSAATLRRLPSGPRKPSSSS